MKIALTRMKGVCLLLLGLATTGGGRSFAADITTLNFTTFVESSSATTTGTPIATTTATTASQAAASPFQDESAVAPGKAVLVEPPLPPDSPSCPIGCSAPCVPCCPPMCPVCPVCPPGIACDSDNFAGAPGRFWFSGEYLNWWTTGAHLPPMVSTLTGPNGNIPQTVYGDRDVSEGDHEGYRMNLGMWLDCQHRWGVESDYFDVTGKPDNYDSGFTNGFTPASTPFPIVRVVFDPATTPNIQPDYVGYAGFYVGRITVETTDYFQSAGIWLRRQLLAREWSTADGDVNWTDRCARTFRLDAIGGYRFARLIDTVDEQDDNFQFNPGQPNYLFDYAYYNSYRATNTFNGGELGLKAVGTFGHWSLDVVSKVAIGVNNQYVSLYNQEVIDVNDVTPGTPRTALNPNALQEFSRNRFSAIPELMVTAGYQLTDHLKFTAGYDLLYWTAVVRAADQIAVEPTSGLPYGTVVGNYATLPPFAWNESHFLAQGVRLGAEVRF